MHQRPGMERFTRFTALALCLAFTFTGSVHAHHAAFYKATFEAVGRADFTGVEKLFAPEVWAGQAGEMTPFELLQRLKAGTVSRLYETQGKSRRQRRVLVSFLLEYTDERPPEQILLMAHRVGESGNTDPYAWQIIEIGTDVAHAETFLTRPLPRFVKQPADQDPEASRPNVIIILSDDAGFADFSLHGSRDFPTPNIDRLAQGGVRFSQGYVSASVCSPSRAGLLTGRYQQRFGHHNNIPPRYSESNGLPVEEVTLADALKGQGYRTIALGKWHLGYAPAFHPLSRGFDDYYGFLQGSRSYFPTSGEKHTSLNQLLRDREPIDEDFEYMTEALGREAAAYIDAHAGGPFFLYIAFNAVHTPLHATEEKLEQASPELSPKRRKRAAMTMSMDDAIGEVLAALDRNKIADNSIVVFVNDNGGQTKSGADNTPLRGRKGQPYEGGIRVPFVARWPARWPTGVVYGHAVSTLDLFPTALRAAVGGYSTDKPRLDGIDLTPFLRGDRDVPPNRNLFWKRKDNFAVRKGDLKLVCFDGGPVELYNLADDPGESNDLIATQPLAAEGLRSIYDAWVKRHEEPRW